MCRHSLARDEAARQRLPLWSGIYVHRYSFFPFPSIECCFSMWLTLINAYAGTGMGAAAVFERGDTADELCNARKVETNSLLSKDAR